MKKNIFLTSAVLAIVVISVIIAGMVIYTATRPEKEYSPANVSAPEVVIPPLPIEPKAPAQPVTKIEQAKEPTDKSMEKIVAMPMPIAEEAPVVPAPQDATIMGESVLPPSAENKNTAPLPPFTPITNTTGPVSPTQPKPPAADTSDQDSTTKPVDIASFVPKPSQTGPAAPEGSGRKELPPFTPTQSATGPVKSDKQ